MLTHLWTAEMNFGRLAFAWLLVLILVAIIAVTVLRLSKKPFSLKKKGLERLIAAWLVVLTLQVITWACGRSETYMYIIDHIMTMGAVYSLISLVLSWAKIIALTVALVVTVRFIRGKRINQK